MQGPFVIPETPDEITPAFLSSVLPGAKVASCEVTRIGEGVGFTGQLARVLLRYSEQSDSAPASLVAKLPASDPKLRQNIWHVYESEFRFYEEVASSIEVRVPTCYYCGRDESEFRGILLIEDFGYGRPGDQLTGCSVADARVAVTSLAALHGSRWIGPSEKRSPDEATRARNQRRRELFPTWWEQFKRDHSEILPDVAMEIGDAITLRVDQVQASLTATPMSFTHGDFRLDNLFFLPDGLGVVDWQKYGQGSVVWDIGRFVVSSLEPDSPREDCIELLDVYHAELQKQGVENYPIGSLVSDFRLSLLQMWLFIIRIAVLLELPNDRSREVMRREIQQISQALVQHRAIDLIPIA